jgi:hypothetical protein
MYYSTRAPEGRLLYVEQNAEAMPNYNRLSSNDIQDVLSSNPNARRRRIRLSRAIVAITIACSMSH